MRAEQPQLDLTFAVRGGRTVLAHRHVGYPFHVTAPLRRRAPGAEVIVQSVAGGLFAGERVAQRVTAGAAAEVVLRLPSAAVVTSRRGKPDSVQAVSLCAQAGATLVYLPRPVILLPGSGLVQSTEVTLGAGATVVTRDGFLLHDPAGSEPAPRCLRSSLAIRRACGRLIALDRLLVEDETIGTGCRGVSDVYRAFGTVWFLRDMQGGVHERIKAAAGAFCANSAESYVAMTRLRDDSGVLVRVAARDGGELDTALTAIVAALLPVL